MTMHDRCMIYALLLAIIAQNNVLLKQPERAWISWGFAVFFIVCSIIAVFGKTKK